MMDEGLNPNGLDQVCYDLYGPTGNQDAHSTTGFNVFCKAIGKDVIEIEDENGKKIIFVPEQQIKIRRKGLIGDMEEMIIKGEQFLETDEFLGYI
jgi:hypothetical protein